jgi:uncharacterized membrane protein YfcA
MLTLAPPALPGMGNLHAMCAVKTLLAGLVNGVAVLAFIPAGAVAWPQAAVMIVGGIVGGYGGERTGSFLKWFRNVKDKVPAF